MRNLIAALVFVISAAAFAGARTPADEDAHRTDAVEEPVVESTCERYGQAADRIIEARFPKPEPGPRSHILADDGGYTGVRGYVSVVPSRLLYWSCEGQHLTLEVQGVWVLDARDIRTALKHLLRDFRDQGLEPVEDGMEITLEPVYVGQSAHFDPRDEVTVSDENVESTQKRARPAWLTDYSLHMNLIGVLSSVPGSPPREEAEPVDLFEWDALMDSLSPGVRASYEGWLLEREHARRSDRLREEAEYAARLRRLRGERASGK